MIQWFLQLPNLLKSSIVGLLLLISAFFLGRCTAPQSTQDKRGVSTRVETKVDTLYIPKLITKTVYIDRPTLVTVYKDRVVPLIQPDGTPTLRHRVYRDSVEVVSKLKVGYTAKVSGVLDSIQLGITDKRPEKIVEKTTTITNTLVKRPTGLYVGGFINKELTNFGPSVDLVRPKFSLGVGYDLKQASPQVRFGVNIFRDKAIK